MATECCWPFCGAEPNECDCEDNVNTKDAETNESAGTCIGSVPLPEPDNGSLMVGRDEISLGHSDDAMRKYAAQVAIVENYGLLNLLADIRKAAGDPTGKLMQPELVELISKTRAERDALAEKVKYWRQRAKSAEGHLPKSGMDAAAKAVHMRSNLSGTPWAELRRDQQIACQIAASAAVRAINASRDARKPKDAAIAAGGEDD